MTMGPPRRCRCGNLAKPGKSYCELAVCAVQASENVVLRSQLRYDRSMRNKKMKVTLATKPLEFRT